MKKRLQIRKKADSPATTSENSQFQSRPFTDKAQHHSGKLLTQAKIENQEFQQYKFEATKLQIQAKHSKVTSEEQERLTLLQAKMNGLLQKREKNASVFGHKFDTTATTSPNRPAQPLNVRDNLPT